MECCALSVPSVMGLNRMVCFVGPSGEIEVTCHDSAGSLVAEDERSRTFLHSATDSVTTLSDNRTHEAQVRN